jgi:hypothetical protein
MKKLCTIVFASLMFALIISCNNEKVSIPETKNNHSDTVTITTAYPISVITQMELEINSKGDTSIIHLEKVLKIKIGASYSSFLSYSGNSLDSSIISLSKNLPKGYCLVIKVLFYDGSKYSFPIECTVQKIVNHMGG